jgi:hypothetical protein
MVTTVAYRAIADKGLILQMRQAGAPMREIAEKAGVSKERVRQILARRLGSTHHEWLSTLQLCTMTGLPRNRIMDLRDGGVIAPAYTWDAGKRHYELWGPGVVRTVADYYAKHRLCKVCNKPLPKNRILFCSDECRQERHKYKHMTAEEKQRVLANIRRYRDKKRQEAERLIESAMALPVGAST